MTHNERTTIRLQLLANGYLPLANRGKLPVMHGWNSSGFIAKEINEKRIASWARRFPAAVSTGVRVEAPMAVMDADVDDSALSHLFWQAIEAHAPQLFQAPTRYGAAEYKCALFFRLDGEPFVRLASHHYRVDDGTHCVEVFGGAKLSGDRASRQFGVAGPHSFNADGSVAAEYVWDDAGVKTLLQTPLDELPLVTREQVAAVIDAFDRMADERGFRRDTTTNNDSGEELFDITEDTRFDVHQGDNQISYEELCALWEVRGRGLRVAWNGRNRTKGLVGWSNRHQCVEVYDTEGCAHHYPADRAGLDEDTFAETLREVAAEHGITIGREPRWREVTKTGAPRASLYNARLAIASLGLELSFDTFHGRLWIGRGAAASPLAPLPRYVGEMTDARLLALRFHLSDLYGVDLTEKFIRDAALELADEHRFDPVADMLAEAQASWDGVRRLDRMAAEHLGCADTELNRQCVRKTMIAAVARVRSPGCKFDTILTLEGPEGWNKSSAWAVLAGEGNFSDERIIGKDSREVQEALAGVWIHENADLAGLRKAEVETVKAFASRTSDRARPAYGRLSVEQPRHSIEVGTTNNSEYLQSQTGNRRFWPMRLERPVDLARLRRERLQLWGEAATAQAAGESLTLPESLWGAAGVEQEARRVKDPWEEVLAELTGVSSVPEMGGVPYIGNGVVHVVGNEWRVASAVIFEHVLRVATHLRNDLHAKRLANVMRALGWEGCLFKLDGKPTRGYKKVP